MSASLFGGVDWGQVMTPDVPILETVVRGTLVYLALVILMRVILKRQAGGLAITDLLVIVLIADAAQSAMAGDYQSIPDGILLVATILLRSLVMDELMSKLREQGVESLSEVKRA
jgi:uncharacterized membrane protein YcaP (DUF421 family)